jgi:molybdenum-dependent DNA-binding transcriptional regulator ModE
LTLETWRFSHRRFFGIDFEKGAIMLGRIQFQHVRYFLALAAEGNFTRAAKHCGISQPSLTNAIKSLEHSLGGRLFERSLKGCRLTELGSSVRPHFERLQSGAEQVGRIARRFQLTGDRQGSGRVSPGASGKSQPITLAAVAVLACLAIATFSPAQAGSVDVQATIRAALPSPVRCGTTSEPLFYCRHEDPPGHSAVIDLSSGRDGPSASLTYNYDDPRRHQLLAVVRRFFGALGASVDAFDACIADSGWQTASVVSRNARLQCHRVELGDRVTHEVFATALHEDATLAQAGVEQP